MHAKPGDTRQFKHFPPGVALFGILTACSGAVGRHSNHHLDPPGAKQRPLDYCEVSRASATTRRTRLIREPNCPLDNAQADGWSLISFMKGRSSPSSGTNALSWEVNNRNKLYPHSGFTETRRFRITIPSTRDGIGSRRAEEDVYRTHTAMLNREGGWKLDDSFQRHSQLRENALSLASFALLHLDLHLAN